MKLQVFNQRTCPVLRGRNREFTAAVSCSAGYFKLNPGAQERLGVKAGDTVSIAQDQDDPTNWYIFKDPEGFRLRKSGRYQLVANSMDSLNAMRQSLNLEAGKSIYLRVAGQPETIEKVKYWGLIYIPKS